MIVSAQERRKIEIFGMSLRNIYSLRRVDRVRNSLIRERCGCKLSALERIERSVLKWFIYVERMREEMLIIGQMWRVKGGEGDYREMEG